MHGALQRNFFEKFHKNPKHVSCSKVLGGWEELRYCQRDIVVDWSAWNLVDNLIVIRIRDEQRIIASDSQAFIQLYKTDIHIPPQPLKVGSHFTLQTIRAIENLQK